MPTCALMIAFAEPLCELMFGRAHFAVYLQLAVAAIPFTQVVRALSLLLRLEFRTRTFVALTTAGVLFQVLAAIVLVVGLRWGVTGVFLAMLIAGVLQAVLGLVLLPGALRTGLSVRWLKAMLRVGLPLVPAGISVWVLSYANRYVLARYSTLADIGILSVALRISSILLFAISAFETAWGPVAYSVAKDHDLARQTYARVLVYFLALVMPVTAALSIFARETTTILATSAYAAGASLVPLYCLSSVFWVLLYIVGMGTGIAKKTYHSTVSTVTAAVVNVLLNFVLIPPYGILGAALATLAANFVALVYMYCAGQHYFRVAYPAGQVLGLVGVTIVAIVPAVIVDHLLPPWHPVLLLVKSALVAVPLAGVLALKVVAPAAVFQALRGFRDAAWKSRSPA